MKKVFKFPLFWVLLFLVCIQFPVYANNLIGDENGTAIGSTAVTARVEMPGTEDTPEDEEIINTGDSAEIAKYIFMILLSGLVIICVSYKHQVNNNQ